MTPFTSRDHGRTGHDPLEEGTAGGGIIVLLSGRLTVKRKPAKLESSQNGLLAGESTFVTGKLRSAAVVAENSATIIR